MFSAGFQDIESAIYIGLIIIIWVLNRWDNVSECGQMKDIVNIFKFIQKIWKLNSEILNKKDSTDKDGDNILEKAVNKTIFKVTRNLESFQYNVVIANIHEIYNLINWFLD